MQKVYGVVLSMILHYDQLRAIELSLAPEWDHLQGAQRKTVQLAWEAFRMLCPPEYKPVFTDNGFTQA